MFITSMATKLKSFMFCVLLGNQVLNEAGEDVTPRPFADFILNRLAPAVDTVTQAASQALIQVYGHVAFSEGLITIGLACAYTVDIDNFVHHVSSLLIMSSLVVAAFTLKVDC
jgi:hypothetical protein